MNVYSCCDYLERSNYSELQVCNNTAFRKCTILFLLVNAQAARNSRGRLTVLQSYDRQPLWLDLQPVDISTVRLFYKVMLTVVKA